jgi:hypothetical protein
MKPLPVLLIVGVAVVLLGSLHYSTLSETPSPADVSDNSDSNKVPQTASLPMDAFAINTAGKSDKDEENNAAHDDILQRQDENPNFETFKDRVYEVQARRNGQPIDAAQLWQASQQPNAWKPLADTPDSLNLTAEEMRDGRRFIEFNPLKLESLARGDTLEIDMGEAGKSFKVEIDGVRSEDDGRNVTWTGDSLDANYPGHLTITKGDTLIVGGITTPDAHYELQVHGNKGWIVSSATLFKGVDQQIIVPEELIKNPPQEVVYLPVETFGDDHSKQ